MGERGGKGPRRGHVHADHKLLSSLQEYIDKAEGAAVAELMVQSMVRLSHDDASCLVIDALIYLGEDGGASLEDIASLLGVPNRTVDDVLRDLVSKTIVYVKDPRDQKEKDKEKEKERESRMPRGKARYFIDYRWAFALAHYKYRTIREKLGLDEEDEQDDEEATEYACQKCGAKHTGSFAVFELQVNEETGGLQCTKCGGVVLQQVILEHAERRKLKEACQRGLAPIRMLLLKQRDLYIPKSERVECSGDFLTTKQYTKHRDESAMQSVQSRLFQYQAGGGVENKGKSLVGLAEERLEVKLQHMTHEERQRREQEGKKRQKRGVAIPPWLKREGEGEEEAAAGKAVKRPRIEGEEEEDDDLDDDDASSDTSLEDEAAVIGLRVIEREGQRESRVYRPEVYRYYANKAGIRFPDPDDDEFIDPGLYMVVQQEADNDVIEVTPQWHRPTGKEGLPCN
eukprot:Sspe_Gene.53949::Locus_29802_Transcript_1_1_Confidence_1.000_Length_1523::g.53949::m.53949/K03136/TFIIE1, GTF2E1, TFA1, tfe; transcription initiation factor TFIIE subunit alpha